jgi:hypothetical protein
MEKRIIILLIVLFLAIAASLGISVYYFLSVPKSVKPAPVTATNVPVKSRQKPLLFTPPDLAKQLEEINKNYPEIITGVIKFLDTKNSFKTTLTTDSGMVYTLWPSQPEVVYQSFGAKNNGKVQVNGKPLGNGMLSWALMRPI